MTTGSADERQPDQPSQHYDVIIVGGRVGGTALAARLGLYGLRVLVLERETFPSLPAVSSPIIYAPTMKTLDEIGADEAIYAHNTPKIHYVYNITPSLRGHIRIPDMDGRDYGYAIDRARFDEALWQNAMRIPTVEGRQSCSVTDILMTGKQATGVTVKNADGSTETIYGDIIVGADGRFSMVARKMDAKLSDEWEQHPTSIYYAYWEGVTHLDGNPAAAAYEGNGPYGYLTLDSADGQTAIALEGRSEALEHDGDAEAFYESMVQSLPELAERTANAHRVTSVRGMKHISNGYREPGGPGWALVGDAYHHKDPLDGQGIYNAVITGKALAQAIRKYKQGQLTWDEALAEYDENARIKTYPMYKVLQRRVKESFYPQPSILPEWLNEQMTRWMFEDPDVKSLVGKMLTRQIPADMVNLMGPPTLFGAIARGPLRDFRKLVELRREKDKAGSQHSE
ncbi:NAD(P)/FAD-dependent oxidoreductase [Phototrophicus methaneseepsis]|uniref:NAD(P)/FAD-dependent oxidoreductase n=1 Tax=Phototrophicus methaneseepsis TaxID=2710758 RepID=A0A7S8IEF1_9CHLR|nr:NAD(P)/FAD-dependent oxidoreductase [Phototrophicus methaneseepsis]QPC82379.1 NAD(P)/FAD-dependent oxidoreductase [Phototrophicus methaneseepsis]